ncbi:MAG: S-layer homology domain-containing protein [Pseudoflavonifractor sp.]
MKKLLSAVLALALAASLAPAAFGAQATATRTEAAQVLAALDIMTGDPSGDLQLDRNVTRAEFVKLTIAASPYKDSVGDAASTAPYPDVPKSSWAAPWIQAGKEQGLVRGNLSGVFEPARPITFAEGATMALRLLGYQDADFSGKWPSGQMALCRTLKLDQGISLGAQENMKRSDALWLFYHLLTAKTKGGQVYLTTLGHTLTPSGEIDRVALINSAMEGPVVAEAGWQSTLPFDLTRAAVYRDGKASTLGAIASTDVVYWSGSMRTLWVYTDRITGKIRSLTPSTSAPTSVTVGGRAYLLETSAAAYALSDLGTFRIGDSCTLLLGRDGGVVAVRTPDATASVTYGIVTGVEPAAYTDAAGKSYTALSVQLTGTDGSPYSYQWTGAKADAPEAGDLVQITDGAQVRRIAAQALTGVVSADGTKIGTRPLASHVEILDTYGKTITGSVTPSRLAGVSLKDQMVRFYATNQQGELTHLILDDVTGDLHRYGVLTEVSEVSYGTLLSGTYSYDVGGAAQPPFVSQNAIWNLTKGPCQIKSGAAGIERIYNLTAVPLTGISGSTALAGGNRYTLADETAVYELRDKSYYRTDLTRVTDGYRLTGYCDKAESAGGRIRVIVAEAVK